MQIWVIVRIFGYRTSEVSFIEAWSDEARARARCTELQQAELIARSQSIRSLREPDEFSVEGPMTLDRTDVRA